MQVGELCICGSQVCGIIGISKIEFFNFSGTERVKQKSICNLVTGGEIVKVF